VRLWLAGLLQRWSWRLRGIPQRGYSYSPGAVIYARAWPVEIITEIAEKPTDRKAAER
jgi:hypothetical protein